MKRSQIKLGGEYAVKVTGTYRGDPSHIVRATVIKPIVKKWTVLCEGDEPPADRTEEVTSNAIVAPWTDYCIDTAHDEARKLDAILTMRAEYEAEWEAKRAQREPLIDAFRGIMVPGTEGFLTGGDPADERDLGEFLQQTFVEGRATGTSFTFDTFAAIGKQILELREAALDAGSGWAFGDVPLED